jgi:hypothetical protein
MTVVALAASVTVLAGVVSPGQASAAVAFAMSGSAVGAVATPAAASGTAGTELPSGTVSGGFESLPGGQAASIKVGAGKTATVVVAGHAGVPGTVASAVALSVATTATPVAGSLTLFPAGSARPSAPDLVWTAGRASGGPAIVKLPANGKISVANAAKHAVTVRIDATGYWLAGPPAVAGAFGPLPAEQVASVSVKAGQTVAITAAGHGDVPKGAGGVALAVATTATAAAGKLFVYPAGAKRPGRSALVVGGPAAGLRGSRRSASRVGQAQCDQHRPARGDGQGRRDRVLADGHSFRRRSLWSAGRRPASQGHDPGG